MTRNQKQELVDGLTEELKSSEGVVVADYQGLTCVQLEDLRNAAREKDVKVRIAKNTLASIAMKNAGIEGIELKDTNIFVWGSDQLDVTKVTAKYAEMSDKFIIKSAYLDGEIADAAKVEALSKMPSRNELLGMLLSTWMAPITNLTIGLDALRAKKEAE